MDRSIHKEQLSILRSSHTQWLSLVFLIVLAYIPALKASFVWDNTGIVENVFLRTGQGLWKIWVTPWATAEPHYWPVVYTIFWIEYHLWGLAPFGYHLVNVLLHAFNTILIWKILQRNSIPGAWLAAAIFGLHPVHVESVAWLIELKDVLSGMFYLVGFLAYMDFENTQNLKWYMLSIGCYVFAVLSKSVAISLPLAILLWYWYKKERLDIKKIFILIPFFAVGAILVLWDMHLTRLQTPFHTDLLFIDRFLLAGHAIWFYIGKLSWPSSLTTFYPMWQIKAKDIWQYIYPVMIGIVIVVLWFQRKRIGKGPFIAVLYFIITLGPMLGFIDFEYMVYSFVADRFQYLASIGLIALFVACIVWVTDKLENSTFAVGSFIILLTLSILTWHQCGFYKDSETLLKYSLTKNPNAWSAWLTLGIIATNNGDLVEGEKDFHKVLEIRPENSDALNNLAYILSQQGKFDQALSYLYNIVKIKPSDADAYNNIGVILNQQGNFDGAVANFFKALEIRPQYLEARNNLGRCLMQQKKYKEAVNQFLTVLQINPGDSKAQENLELIKTLSKDMVK